VRQSKILTAEGEKQSAILNAEGARQAAVLRADGQAQAIDRVFTAIHRNDPDPKLLAYQYLQVLPELAKGEGNTFWVIPSEVTNALQGVSRAFAKDTGESSGPKVPPHEAASTEGKEGGSGPAALEAPTRDRAAEAARAAQEAAAEAHQEAEKAKAEGRDALP
jgi:hypothetical protein